MKKWNKPELLNLMLQETKTEMETSENGEAKRLSHTCYGNEIFTNGVLCATNMGDKPESCLAGHGNLKHKPGFWGYQDLVACCVKDDVVFDS